ncbi:aldehyde oxidase GLOX1-like [Momordica charantia]|uniref:Aldehyde oxidase GLOX1-like n=1 Tax=Momordica charantia TaxID=3673 RepID=A0A6J1DTN8_MOMCH|nr:aldehyde oxidase GLOX1-like [Momordica charantia]
MAAFLKAAPFLLLLFPLLFVSALAQFDTVGGNYGTGSNPLDNTLKEILADPSTGTNDAGKRDATDTNPAVPVETNLPGITFEAGPEVVDESNKRDFKTNYGGMWKLVVQNSFVSAMHMILMPNNKMIIFDASAFHISQIKLPGGKCFPFTTDQGAVLQDCWAHGVEYDIASGNLRPLTMSSDPWCSSGGLDINGRVVNTGGWKDGTRAVRYIGTCENCDWKEYPTALARPRWYATQITMPDGGFFLVGGRRSFSVEFVPAEGASNARAIKMPFLDETTDLDENNLYPFVHLSTDGNVFIFANSRSVLFDPKAHTILHEYPILDGGSRNYPASGMSALLPLKLCLDNAEKIPAEVIVCGGARPEAYRAAEKGNFMPALQDCARLEITKPNAVWKKEMMPSPRVMGDMLILPTGDLLLINGATSGTSAWNFAEGPNFTPLLYTPEKPAGARFRALAPTTIPRMYHSSSAVLPDGTILVAGSNTNSGYLFVNVKYPTELRVEKFWPPYLDPALTEFRPAFNLNGLETKLGYGKDWSILFHLNVREGVDPDNDIRVTMYPPPFTTHGYSMNQRLLVLAIKGLEATGPRIYKVTVATPPSAIIAPPGYYLAFVVYRGVPSVGVWVTIQ